MTGTDQIKNNDWENPKYLGFASLSELDDVHNTIFKNKRYKYGKIISF
jgi:hypothetical protein